MNPSEDIVPVLSDSSTITGLIVLALGTAGTIVVLLEASSDTVSSSTNEGSVQPAGITICTISSGFSSSSLIWTDGKFSKAGCDG